MINLGNIELADLRLGASQVKAAYLGSKQIWGGEEPGPTADWLCFTAEEANSTVKLNKVGSPAAISLEYSYDGSSWADYTWSGNTGATLTLATVGAKVYMRAKSQNATISQTYKNYYKFQMTGLIAASGNIQTLLKSDEIVTTAPSNCYRSMFSQCSSLIQAPELPATTISGYCYYSMFFGCTSLTTAPALPATTVDNQCYREMFSNCTSLTTAPALPATTLANSCYSSMFANCSSLTTAPTLPATTLARNCYQQMFQGCASLSSMNVGLTAWESDYTYYWLMGVAASGTFTCPAELPDTRDASHIPTGWNVVKPQQELSAVCFTAEEANSTVKLYKYNSGAPTLDIETSTDGQNWSAYTQGTVLTAANVGDKVYFRAGSTGNTTVSVRSNTNRFAITGKMAASGDIQYLLSQDGTTQPTVAWCFNCLFYGQSGLTKAPKCGATGFPPSECYGGTFEKCTGLTEYVDTPLPQMWEDGATNLPHWVYVNMFPDCTNLSAIAVDWTSWPREGTYSYSTATWLKNVAANGIFICPAELPDIRGDSNIPRGWNIVHPQQDIFYNEAPTRVWYNDGTSAEYNIVGQATTSNVLSAGQIEKIEFGNTVTEIVGTIFRNSTNLKYFYTGWNCESLPSRVCNDAKSLSSVVIGPSLKTINSEYAFGGAGPITNLVFHDDCQLSNFGHGAFHVTVSCDELTIKSRASSINFAYWAFSANGLSESNRKFVNTFIFDVDVVPTADTNAFATQGFTRGVAGNYAVVPDNLVAQWKTTSPWSNWASNIISMTEYEAIKNNS